MARPKPDSADLAAGEEFLRLKRVLALTGLSERQLYRDIEAGSFPRGKAYPGKKIVFWLLSDVRQWQAEQLRLAVAA